MTPSPNLPLASFIRTSTAKRSRSSSVIPCSPHLQWSAPRTGTSYQHAARGEAPPAWVRRQPAESASGQSAVPPRLTGSSSRPWGLEDHRRGFTRYAVYQRVNIPIQLLNRHIHRLAGEAILVTGDVRIMHDDRSVTLSRMGQNLEGGGGGGWYPGQEGSSTAAAART